MISVFEMVVLATDLLMLTLTTPPSLVSKPVSRLTEVFAAALLSQQGVERRDVCPCVRVET